MSSNPFFKISHPLIVNAHLINNSIGQTISGPYWGQVNARYKIDKGYASIEIDTSALQYERPLHAWLFFEEEREERHKIIAEENPKITFELGLTPLQAKYAGFVITSNDGITLYGRAVIFREGRDTYDDTKLISPYHVQTGNLNIEGNTLTIHLSFFQEHPKTLQAVWIHSGCYLLKEPIAGNCPEGYAFRFEHTPRVVKGLWKGGVVDEKRRFLAQVSFWLL